MGPGKPFPEGNPGKPHGATTDPMLRVMQRVAKKIAKERETELEVLWLEEIRKGGKDGYKFFELLVNHESGKPTEVIDLKPRQALTIELPAGEKANGSGD